MAQNNQINTPTPFAINKGGTGVTSVTSAPTASAWSGWDANKNASAVGFIPGYTTTVTSASPVTLTVGSNQQQYFTGSTAQTLTMPVANTCVVGQYWSIINNSSAVVTIQSSGANTILALPASSETVVTCVTASGTGASSWTTSPAVSGSGTVNSGTINQLAYYAATGTAVSGLSIVNSAVLTTTSGGVPTWVAYTGTNAPVLGTAPTISAPLIDQINDQVNNLKVLAFTGVASAVNYIQATNAATAASPFLAFTGSDSNVTGLITVKGTSPLIFTNNFGGTQATTFTVNANASAVNSVNVTAVVASANPTISVQGSDTNITLSLTGKGTGRVQILGISTNTAAAAGYVGELLTAANLAASPITFSTGVAKTLQTVTLTPGDWDVWGNIFCTGTTVTSGQVSISTTNNTMADNSLITFGTVVSSAFGLVAPQRTFLVTTATTVPVYVVGIFAGTGTLSCSGAIYARRRS